MLLRAILLGYMLELSKVVRDISKYAEQLGIPKRNINDIRKYLCEEYTHVLCYYNGRIIRRK